MLTLQQLEHSSISQQSRTYLNLPITRKPNKVNNPQLLLDFIHFPLSNANQPIQQSTLRVIKSKIKTEIRTTWDSTIFFIQPGTELSIKNQMQTTNNSQAKKKHTWIRSEGRRSSDYCQFIKKASHCGSLLFNLILTVYIAAAPHLLPLHRCTIACHKVFPQLLYLPKTNSLTHTSTIDQHKIKCISATTGGHYTTASALVPPSLLSKLD